MATNWSTQNKSGQAWLYDEADITYEMIDLFYETFGYGVAWSNAIKN